MTKTVTRTALFLAVTTVALTAATSAYALEPDEVAVLANASDRESMELARYYLQLRGIPETNLIALRTASDPVITLPEFQKQIREPVRAALRERRIDGRVRCLVVLWNLPLHVVPTRGDAAAESRSPLQQAWASVAADAHRRLALDLLLLDRLAETFPPAPGEDLTDLAGLFGPLPAPPPELPDPEALPQQIARGLLARQEKLDALRSPSQRRMAWRQMMGLYREAYGVEGLTTYIRRHRPPDAPPLNDFRDELAAAEKRVQELRNTTDPRQVPALAGALQTVSGTAAVLTEALRRAGSAADAQMDASVDSELAMLWFDDYDRAGPAPNPLYWKSDASPAVRAKTLMTARIDAASRADAMRMIRSSLAAEAAGLEGAFYVDAGGPLAEYDNHLRTACRMVRLHTRLRCVLDEKPTLFSPDAAPHAALYVGWSSPGRYVSAFLWVPGAVGWHVAGNEVSALRDPDSTQWGVQMLRHGAAATLGAVDDPRLGAFPLPEEFFALLLTGKYTLAECYWRTVPHASWRMTLLGDPLYTPFAKNPQLPAAKLPNGLAP